MEHAGTPTECATCQQWKPANAFDEENPLRHVHRACIDCVETRQCIECSLYQQEFGFTPADWLHAGRLIARRCRCRACMCRNRAAQPCQRCGLEKGRDAFSEYAWRTPAQRVCSACTTQAAESKKCTKCDGMKAQDAFSEKAWRTPAQRVCSECTTQAAESSKCTKCGGMKAQDAFS